MGKSLPASFDPSAVPDPQELSTAFALPVFDEEGRKITLGEAAYPSEFGGERTVVVFIRHFHCGMCMEYVSALTKHLSPTVLSSRPSPIRLIIIGCGSSKLLTPYKDLLSCPFPIYADPTKETYRKLGMTFRSLDMGKNCDGGDGVRCGEGEVEGEQGPDGAAAKGNGGYVQKSLWGIITSSIGAAVKMGHFFADAGDQKQLGGEFVFARKGKEVGCTFASRMRTTRDHVPIAKLASILDLPLDSSSSSSNPTSSPTLNGTKSASRSRSSQPSSPVETAFEDRPRQKSFAEELRDSPAGESPRLVSAAA